MKSLLATIFNVLNPQKLFQSRLVFIDNETAIAIEGVMLNLYDDEKADYEFQVELEGDMFEGHIFEDKMLIEEWLESNSLVRTCKSP